MDLPADDARRKFELPGNELPLARVHAVLDRLSQNTHMSEEAAEESELVKQSGVVQDSLVVASKLWERGRAEAWPEEVGSQSLDRASFMGDFSKAENPKAESKKETGRPCKTKKKIKNFKTGKAYMKLSPVSIAAWWQKVRQSKEPPTPEHEKFLEAVIARCVQEATEAQERNQESIERSEPLRTCLLGIPGAGKSTCLRLVRDFFETCLGWEMGVHFVYLATQNTMAALIGGFTVHSWGTIPVNSSNAANKINSKANAGDMNELFSKTQCLRWIFSDECSTLSAYLIGILDSYLRRACSTHDYSKRSGKKRPFGGMSVVFCGDLWQLPPMKSNPIFANPFKKGYDFWSKELTRSSGRKSSTVCVRFTN